MPVPSGAPLNTDQAAHLLRRATFGPTPESLGEATMLHLEGWLEWQLAPQTIDDTFTDGLMARYPLLALNSAQLQAQLDDGSYDAMNELVAHRRPPCVDPAPAQRGHGRLLEQPLQCDDAVGSVWDLKTTEDRDVIRPNALGNFTDLLMASAKSPAMLRYLNNDRRAATRPTRTTVASCSSCTPSASTAATPRSTSSTARYYDRLLDRRSTCTFLYRPNYHYTGPVTVMGFTANGSQEGGLAVGEEYLRYLATHPATANYLATKLVTRFVADEPPATLSQRSRRPISTTAPPLLLCFAPCSPRPSSGTR